MVKRFLLVVSLIAMQPMTIDATARSLMPSMETSFSTILPFASVLPAFVVEMLHKKTNTPARILVHAGLITGLYALRHFAMNGFQRSMARYPAAQDIKVWDIKSLVAYGIGLLLARTVA